MSTQETGLLRKAQVLAFLLKHRNAGVFGGLANDASEDDAPVEGDAGAPDRFVEELEALGPAFIKLGQALSTRPDMVPPHYIAALERIQDNVDPLPIDVVRAAVEEALGVKLSAVFATFDEAPLGSASLAQVHRATLRDGRAVAVKVQRPDIRDAIRTDLEALASLAATSDRWTDMGRRMHFSAWVDEFRRTLMAELDYRIEAENLERFHAHFAEYPELFVPLPLWDFTKPQVLTMTLVTGVKVTDISGLRRTEQDFGLLASALVRGYLDQVFVHGEIHADPHPGNLLVTEDDRIALLDLGMVAHVPPKRREQMLKLLFASVDGRGEEAAAESISMSTRLEDFDEERYVRDVGQMVARYAAHSGANGQSEGRLVLDLTILGAECGLRTPPELTLLGKTLLNLESACKALDPSMDVKTIVESHLDHVMRARFRKSFSPANLASEAMEVQALVRESPRKIANLLTLLAENKMQVRVTGLVESQLIENLQKIANRISTGIIVASLVLASALLMRQEGGARLFGYPALAFVLFVVAAGLGLGIVVSAMARDRKAKPDETRGPG